MWRGEGRVKRSELRIRRAGERGSAAGIGLGVVNGSLANSFGR